MADPVVDSVDTDIGTEPGERATSVLDVVVLGGAAARAAASDFGLGRHRRAPADDHAHAQGRQWVAVASQSGAVVGVALARADPDQAGARLAVVDLVCREHADRDQVRERLLAALGPLNPGRVLRLALEPGVPLVLPTPRSPGADGL